MLGYNSLMRTLTALMLFATTPVVSGDCDTGSRCFRDFEKVMKAYLDADFQKAIPFLKRALGQGHKPSGKFLS